MLYLHSSPLDGDVVFRNVFNHLHFNEQLYYAGKSAMLVILYLCIWINHNPPYLLTFVATTVTLCSAFLSLSRASLTDRVPSTGSMSKWFSESFLHSIEYLLIKDNNNKQMDQSHSRIIIFIYFVLVHFGIN